MRYKGLMLFFLFTILAGCSINGDNDSFSIKEVEKLVVDSLESHFNYEFEINEIRHDPVNQFYTIDAYLAENPRVTFYFKLSESVIRDENIEKIYIGVVAELYRKALAKVTNEKMKASFPHYQFVHSRIAKPDSLDFKSPQVADMEFKEFASTYKKDTYYHFYFLTEEKYSDRYIEENEPQFKTLLNGLNKHHMKNIRLVVVFPNDVYLDSSIMDNDRIQSKDLETVFKEEYQKNPGIPGFNYSEWKRSVKPL